MRDSKLSSVKPLRESQFKRLTAVKLFRDGRPTKYVDVGEADKIKQMVDSFLQKVEDLEKGDMWMQVKGLFTPAGERQPTPMPTSRHTQNRTLRQAERRRKKREELRKAALEKEKQIQRHKQQVLRENRLKQSLQAQMRNQKRAADAKRRRQTKKMLEDHVAHLRIELQGVLAEQVDMMKENLEDHIVAQIKKLTAPKTKTTTTTRRRSKRLRKSKENDVSPQKATPKSVKVAPKSIKVTPQSVEVASKSVEVAPKSVVVSPTSVPVAATSMVVPRTSVALAPTSVSLVPKSVEVPPNLVTVAPNPVPPRHCQILTVPTPYDTTAQRYQQPPPYGLHSYPPPDLVRPVRRALPVRRPRPVRREIFFDPTSEEDVDDELYYASRHERNVNRAVDVLTGRSSGRKRRRVHTTSFVM